MTVDGRCGRARCQRPAVGGHDFCVPCLTWLRDDTVDDPIPGLPDVSIRNPEPVDEVVAWVETFGRPPR